MRVKLLVLAALTAGVVFTPALTFAAGGCCDGKAYCQDMAACCKNHEKTAATLALLPQVEPVTEVARQLAVVSFMKPVKVGEWILLGKYIIEHDNNRMARGLPCTHIYAANRPHVPVVRFHCTHLERDRVERDTVVLKSTGDPMIREFAAFQFAGETAAHGVPAAR
jgi:hypothetical protein